MFLFFRTGYYGIGTALLVLVLGFAPVSWLANPVINTHANASTPAEKSASNDLHEIHQELVSLRDKFSRLRQQVEEAEDIWRSNHSRLLSIEDLRAAHQSLLKLSEGDFAVLLAVRSALQQSESVLLEIKANEAFLNKTIAHAIQRHLTKLMRESFQILQDLNITELQALSHEQKARLDYYRLEKTLEQVDFSLLQKSNVLKRLREAEPRYDARAAITSPNNGGVNSLSVSGLLTVLSTPILNGSEIIWPEAIRLLNSRDNIHAPARGRVIRKFGQHDTRGVPLGGHRIDVPSGSRVHAPYDGLVVYADFFRNQGGVIIVAHRGGWHTVLTGLGRINSVLGQWVLQDEPVGIMPTAKKGPTILYHELRRNGNPVAAPLP